MFMVKDWVQDPAMSPLASIEQNKGLAFDKVRDVS
jgi:hypothetical protein